VVVDEFEEDERAVVVVVRGDCEVCIVVEEALVEARAVGVQEKVKWNLLDFFE
jgi:hypothetical protein